MIHLGHLINPVRQAEAAELSYAQPITFESMRRSRQLAQSRVKVDLLTTQFPEDHAIIPDYFLKTKDLERSVLDVGIFRKRKKLPLLKDLLDRLYHNTEANYLIYTNVDIAVQTDFYLEVLKRIQSGLDAFIINRRRIPAHFRSIDELPEMYAHRGLPHPGFDCFVFKRDLYPHFQLENVCVGIPFVGITLSQNIFCYARNFKLFHKDFLTFHLGTEIFKQRDFEYYQFNRMQFWNAMSKIWLDLDSSKFPWGHRNFIFKLIKYGLHPSIPIRLFLMLEFKKYGLGALNKLIKHYPGGSF